MTEIKTTKIYLFDSLSSVTNHILNRVIYTKDDGKFLMYNGTDYADMGGSGSGITVCATSSNLPEDAEENDVAITLDKGATYVYTNDAWVTQDIFTNDTEIPTAIGGFKVGDTLNGMTTMEAVERLVLPEVTPTVGTATNTLTLGYTAAQEVGTTLSSLKIQVTFNKASISPYYSSTGTKISDTETWTGDAVSYTIASQTGLTSYAGTYTVADSDYATTTGLLIPSLSTTQPWGGVRVQASTTYAAGSVDSYTSYGNLARSNAGGTTSTVTTSITSSLPYYATSNSIDVLTRQAASVTNINGTITSTITLGSNGESGLVAESAGGGKQCVLLPSNWLTGSFTMTQYDTVSGTYKSVDASQFTVISGDDLTLNWSGTISGGGQSKTLGGDAPVDTNQEYKLLVYNSDTSGVRTIQITRS